MSSFPTARRFSGRTPRGVRGLKWKDTRKRYDQRKSHPSRGAWIEIRSSYSCRGPVWSHPSRGAWIEILLCAADQVTGHASHPSRGAWIEIQVRRRRPLRAMSHPSRGAWIEIRAASSISSVGQVAPLAGAWIELSYRGAWSVCRRRRIGARVDSNFHPAPLLFAFLFVDWYSRE